jgi:tetratricopeptide (TPR) repeat protein
MQSEVVRWMQIACDLHDQGRLAEAEPYYEKVLEAAPDDPAALGRLGALALQTGRPAHAADLLGRAVGLAPEAAQLRNHLGVALRAQGQSEAAVASYDAAIGLQADYAEAHNNRGNALLDLGRAAEALASFEAALALRPRSVDWLNNRGIALLRLQRVEEAVASFDAAIALNPDHAPARYNRGNALARTDRLDAAVESYDAAIARRPDYAKAFNNRGEALTRLARFAPALADFDAAIRLQPDDAELHNNRGDVLRRMGRMPEALASFETALQLRPDYPDARFHRSLALLALARFDEGWRDYEHRWRSEAFLARSSDAATASLRTRFVAEGDVEDLADRRVLVVAEQGIGDVVMFASILPDLIAAAGEVALLCERRLHRLFAASFPQISLIDSAPPPSDAFDLVLPIGGLARLFRRRREDFPGRPYLAAGPAALERWRRALGPKTAPLRVGVSWRGGTATTGHRDRSLELSDLRPILDLAECEVICLQYGDPRAEVAALNERLPRSIRLFAPAEIADFEDLAGLIQTLDAVVSVQNTNVHLAGALGAPGLAMIPHVAEWRYGAAGAAMPWYETVELFRQGADRDWAPVIRDIAERLRQMA